MTIQCGGELLKTPGGATAGTVHVLSTIETDRNGRDMTPPRFGGLKPEDVEAPNFFQPVADRLAKSHRIRVYLKTPDGGWAEAEFVVLHADRNFVLVQRQGEWERFKANWGGELDVRQAANGKYEVVHVQTSAILRTGLAIDDANNFVLVEKMKAGADQVGPTFTPVDKAPVEMSIAELQSEHKRLTGAGFKPGTPKAEMVAALDAAKAKAA
jgi:hypothetical protein